MIVGEILAYGFSVVVVGTVLGFGDGSMINDVTISTSLGWLFKLRVSRVDGVIWLGNDGKVNEVKLCTWC